MIKKPPLLPTLAVTSLAGAAVFLTMTAPSCEPQHAGAVSSPVESEQASPTAQQRAFTAAAQTPVTADQDFRPPPPAAPANTSGDSPEAARMQVARRDFLADSRRWQPGEKAKKVAERAGNFQAARRDWLRWLMGQRMTAPDLPGRMSAARTALDRTCSDRGALTKEAQKEWDAWESKGWRGYPSPVKLVGLDVSVDIAGPGTRFAETPAPRAGAQAAADFQQRRDALVLPLLNRLEQLDDDSFAERPFVVFNSAAAEPEETPAQVAERRRQRELASQLREQVNDVMSHSRLLAARWHDRQWEGYDAGLADPDQLPEVPKEPMPAAGQ